MPKTLQTIEDYAFGMSKLTSIVIPENVKSIGQEAFRYSSSLSEVIMLPTTPTTTRSAIFGSTHPSLQIKVPPASLNAYKTAYGWDSHADHIVANTN
ncbi:MAG: leucine-rich repeat domain-containing protein [Dysgonamonadaceae bacterium]|nr:leucine-rich repeat domain-containing protein [Dysgonamonadaceae bacterium]